MVANIDIFHLFPLISKTSDSFPIWPHFNFYFNRIRPLGTNTSAITYLSQQTQCKHTSPIQKHSNNKNSQKQENDSIYYAVIQSFVNLQISPNPKNLLKCTNGHLDFNLPIRLSNPFACAYKRKDRHRKPGNTHTGFCL